MMQKLKHRWSVGHNYMSGITFGKWLRLLADNQFRISPAYLHRALFITMTSLANTGFAAVENLRYTKTIAQTDIKNPPVFILGHWRSGTTLLHDLLAQDVTQFQYANTYQVVNPLTFLTTEKFMAKWFSGLVPETRPMDNMAISFASPQEDEFAPLLMSLYSVYLGISFPERQAHYEKYLSFRDVDRAETDTWCSAFMRFCQKLSMNDDRALLLKSPPHTARIRLLLKMFPDAKFIHIHRDPYRVFLSQRHFFDTAGWYTYLQRPNLDVIDEGILQRYTNMFDAFFEDVSLIPEGQLHEIRFEDLEADPAKEISGVYDALGLNGFAEFEPGLNRYVESLEGYKKNTFTDIDDATRALVAKRWKRSFEVWGYDFNHGHPT